MVESGEMLLCGQCAQLIDTGERCFAKTSTGPRYCQTCWPIVNADEIEQDAKTDRWHTGYFATQRPADPDELDGWLHRKTENLAGQYAAASLNESRPEGYYHMPLGTFE